MDYRFNESRIERERMRKRVNERGSELVEVTGDWRLPDLVHGNSGQVSAEISELRAFDWKSCNLCFLLLRRPAAFSFG